jgi:hypothetical protein
LCAGSAGRVCGPERHLRRDARLRDMVMHAHEKQST